MTEVINIDQSKADFSSMSNSDIKKFNKEVLELQESIQKLDKLQNALESRIQISDNSVMSTIISEIESTKKFAIETIKNNEIGRETNRQVLRESYETIQKLLKENRKEKVLDSNNQINTLQKILNQHKEDQKKLLEENKKSKVLSNKPKEGIVNSINSIGAELAQGTKTATSITNEALSSTQLGMLINSAVQPTKLVGNIVKNLSKGALKTTGLVGNSIYKLFKAPLSKIKEAKSLEEKSEKAKKKAYKETKEYRKEVLSKLGSTEDTIKKILDSSEGGFFSNLFSSGLGKAFIGTVFAGAGAIFWKYVLSEESKEKVKNFVNTHIIGSVINYIKTNYPKLAKVIGIDAEETKIYDNNNGTYDITTSLDPWGLIKLTKKNVPNNSVVTNAIKSAVLPDTGSFKSVDDNGLNILNYLKSKGYSDEAAAAIYGNIMQESSGNPTATNSSGHKGLFQWDKDIRYPAFLEWAQSNGKNPNSIYSQIDYMIEEPSEGYKVSPEIMNALSLEEATIRFRDEFERPGRSDLMKESTNARYTNSTRSDRALEGYQKLLSLRDAANEIKSVNGKIVIDSDSISSADKSQLRLLNNQLTYDEQNKSILLESSNKNYQDLSQLFGGLNNSLNSGLSNVTEAITKTNNTAYNDSNIDDIGMIALNSGSI